MTLDRRSFLLTAAGAAFRPWEFWQDSDPLIHTKQGTLSGTFEGNLKVFKGIPFAQPPTGSLRFKAPQPPKPWQGIKQAIKNAPPSIQSGQNDSEDCLYLNLWMPEGSGPFPVLLWIHGGGNTGGGTQGQSGASFARQGIIVITVAYRLGALGYLKLDHFLGPDYIGSGSNGIRDQIAALKWVNENIRAFNGDPSQVTIAGQSAGAKNVAALLASPEAKGLFSRAIMHSGSGHTVHAPHEAEAVTSAFLKHLNIPTSESQKLLTLPANEILAAQNRLLADYPHNYPFRPTTDCSTLPSRPVDSVDQKIPLLLGTTRDESLVFFSRESVNRPIESRAISNMPFKDVATLEDRYNAAFPDLSPLDLRLRLISAEEYWMPSVRFAESHSRRGGQAYMYRFDHQATDPNSPNFGYAVHGSEMNFAWNHHDDWSMHETWVDFIKDHSPKSWPAYNTTFRQTMVFGQDGKTHVAPDPRGDERRLWNGFLT